MELNFPLYQKFLELRRKYSLEDLILVFTRKKALAFEAIRSGLAMDIPDDVHVEIQRIALEMDGGI